MLSALTALLLCAAPAQDEGSGIHPNVVQQLVLADAKKIHKDDAPYMRYFRVTTPESLRGDFLVVFCVHLNMLSTRKKFKWPTFVSDAILRIDVRDYGWDERGKGADNVLLVWERTAARDPYFHSQVKVLGNVKLPVAWPGGFDAKRKETYEASVYRVEFSKGDVVPRPAFWLDQDDADKLRRLLLTESPILDAEWFFVQSARQQSLFGENEPGIGYYDWLALKDRDAFFELAGADPKLAKKINRVWKGAVVESGVARHNRLVFRFGATGDFVWGTFDAQDPRDRGDLSQNLRQGEFVHQAEEYFAVLPNRMPFTLLSNDKGVRQATAPDAIISADTSALALASNKRHRHNDTPVHANLSCIGCHAGSDMLMDVNDRIRSAFPKGGPLLLVDPNKKVTRELEDEYLTSLEKELKRDRTLYVDAITEVTISKLNPKGWTLSEFATQHRAVFDRYAYAPITHDSGARSLGVDKKKMLGGIKAHASQKSRGQTDIALAAWAADGKGMKRTTWEQRYSLAMSLALGVQPPETKEKQKP